MKYCSCCVLSYIWFLGKDQRGRIFGLESAPLVSPMLLMVAYSYDKKHLVQLLTEDVSFDRPHFSLVSNCRENAKACSKETRACSFFFKKGESTDQVLSSDIGETDVNNDSGFAFI